jgi:hypothetical protein
MTSENADLKEGESSQHKELEIIPEEYPKIMYVISKEGLRKRSEPSIDSNITGTLLYGERIVVDKISNVSATVDGITDYWYSIIYEKDAWVFGGYLSETFPSDLPVIYGIWDDISREGWRFIFASDHSFANVRNESSLGVFGTWELNGDIITIYYKMLGDQGDPPFAEIDEVENINLIINGINGIILKYPDNRTVKLKRSNDL